MSVPGRSDASTASRPQLTELQRHQIERARYLHRAWEQEIGAQVALGSSWDGAISWVLGSVRFRLGEMLDLVDELTGGER